MIASYVILKYGGEPRPQGRPRVGHDEGQHPDRSHQLDPRTDQKRQERSHATTSACPIRSRSFSSSPATAPTNGPTTIPIRPPTNRPAIMPTVAPTIPARVPPEQFGHVPRQKIIRRSHRGRQPRPQPHLGGRQRRIAARIGAKKPRIAQHRAGQDGDNATHDADEATEESRYGEEYVHLVRFLSFHGSRCGRRIYSTLPDGWSPCRERPPTGGTSSPPRTPCGRRRR